MPISFSGDVPSSSERVLTGLYSFDRAVGDSGGRIGFPLRTLVELYGKKGVGKTSMCLSLMGRIANKTNKPISILDFERQDPDTVENILSNAGYEGDVHYITNQSKETPEDTLERFVDTMWSKEPPIGLVDSIGGFYPNAEVEGKIGDSNMGVRAREIGQFSRRLVRSLQIADNPHSIFMTNHEHPTIGGMTQGTVTPGGETKKYLSHLRLRIKPAFLGKSTIDYGSSWLIEGRVEHNRDGYSKTTFYVYMVAGEGIHTGLTAMWDCLVKGLATSSAANIKETSTISLDGKSYGKLKNILDKRKDAEMFVAFSNALKVETVEDDTVSENDNEE
jgi:recombination protein RecA